MPNLYYNVVLVIVRHDDVVESVEGDLHDLDVHYGQEVTQRLDAALLNNEPTQKEEWVFM